MLLTVEENVKASALVLIQGEGVREFTEDRVLVHERRDQVKDLKTIRHARGLL